MKQTYPVRCPDCGSLAIRSHSIDGKEQHHNCSPIPTTKTECPSCDYLAIVCSVSGRVIEAHTSCMSTIPRKQQVDNSPLVISNVTNSTKLMPWSSRLSA